MEHTPERNSSGLLFVVGSGHCIAGQITVEALTCIQKADKVLYSCDDITGDWIKQVRPDAETLNDLYEHGKDRSITYNQMVDRILAPLRRGLRVCAVFYGHPGFLVFAGNESIRRARQEGFQARMLPGISAFDALVSDLEFDPGDGCQMYEATDFLSRKRRYDPTSALVLWQIGAIGIEDHRETNENWSVEGVRILAEFLARIYSADHVVTVYEASPYPICGPIIQKVPISQLTEAAINTSSTLYVPPREDAEWDMDMVQTLNFS